MTNLLKVWSRPADNTGMKKISIQSDVTGRELQKQTVKTHKQVGEILGISSEAVRVIEQRALAKLRRKLTFGQAKQLSRQP